MNKLPAVVAVLAASACSSQSPEISAQLSRQVMAAGFAAIDLSQLGPATWERVCVLPPYSTNARAEQILGFKWNAEGKTSITTNDGINVVVFVRGEDVLAYVEHPRNAGDLFDLQPSCLARASAKLVRRVRSDGWVQLVAQNAA